MTNNFNCNPEVVGNWINEKIFKPNSRKFIEKFTILNIGHTGFTKDWPTFFKAINKTVHYHKCKNLKIIILITQVFDEKSKLYVPNLAKENKVFEYCEFHYEVSRKDIPEFFNISSVFVSSSINETFGIAMCEAIFSGLPVIATSNGGADDIINNDNGIKVPVSDYEELSEKIKMMYDGELKFDKIMVSKSLNAKFGTEAFRGKLRIMYDKIIENYTYE